MRPARRAGLLHVESAEITASGLAGDHARPGNRAVTLIQAEHLPVIAALSGHDALAPETLRRNIVVSGLNLTAARHRLLRVGTAVLRFSVPCAPCSRMEAALGEGGYNAMRGHGGWCCEVVEPGRLERGGTVTPV